MRYVDREHVSCDLKISDILDDPLSVARYSLHRVERELATVAIEMAEASCKGVPKPEQRLRAVHLAYRDAAATLGHLRAESKSRSDSGSNGVDR